LQHSAEEKSSEQPTPIGNQVVAEAQRW
jgi:hypothetical protein